MLKLILTVRNFNFKHFIINRVIYQNKPSLTKFTNVRSYLFHELMANINFRTHFFSSKRNRRWKSRIIFFSYFFLINFIENCKAVNPLISINHYYNLKEIQVNFCQSKYLEFDSANDIKSSNNNNGRD